MSARQNPKPFLQRLSERMRSFTLSRLDRELKRCIQTRARLQKSFRDWRKAAPSERPDGEWPNALPFATILMAERMLLKELQRRVTPSEKTVAMLAAMEARRNR